MRTLSHLRHSFIALVGTIFLFAGAVIGSTAYVLTQKEFLAAPQPASASFPFMATTTATLQAKAAIVYDPSNGKILFSKNIYESLPLASITKLMTAEIVLTALSPETKVPITSKSLTPSGDSGFHVGDTFTLYQLLEIGLVASSNDAMEAAAQSLGDRYIEQMNQVAKGLGFTQTLFYNATGLDVNNTTSGAYSSAYDVARMAALFYKQHPYIFELTQKDSVHHIANGHSYTSPATAKPLLSIPGFVGAKTGYTDLAGGNVVAIVDIEIGHPVVIAVLGSTKKGRFEDIRTLVSITRDK